MRSKGEGTILMTRPSGELMLEWLSSSVLRQCMKGDEQMVMNGERNKKMRAVIRIL